MMIGAVRLALSESVRVRPIATTFQSSVAKPSTRRVIQATIIGLGLGLPFQGALAQTMALPGKFDVNASGAATYTVPIAVPPGTAGMHPSLTLEYSSQGQNGIMGMGWSLGGLPSVTRCPQTVAQDGVRGTVNFNGNDRFCLDGQRLMVISGSYGADGAEYRTEIESFARVISHGTAGNGPAWFEVHTKSGQVMEFGHSTDSQLLAQGTSTARVWAVNKISDTVGNFYTVTYTNDPANGQDYPIEIEYTGNATAGITPYNKVQFVYASRPDIVPLYQAGSLTRVTVLLNEVQAYAGDALVNDYKLAYQQSAATQRTQLASITLCYGDGTCQAPTTFSWQSGNANLSVVSNVAGQDGSLVGARPYVGDFNGDGTSDILWDYEADQIQPSSDGRRVLWTSAGSGNFSVTGNVAGQDAQLAGWVPVVADINRDGKSDLFWYPLATNTGPAGVTNEWLSTNTSALSLVVTGPTEAVCCKPSIRVGPLLMLGDVNGDFRPDAIWVANGGDGTTTLWIETTNPDGSVTQSFVQGPGIHTGIVNLTPFFTASGPDFNGDGVTDLVWVGTGNTGLQGIWFGNGDSTFRQVMGADGSVNGYLPHYADINGDNNFDILWDSADANGRSTGRRILWLSRGDGTFTVLTNLAGQDGTLSGYRPYFGDFNGDGKMDVLWDQEDNNGLSTGFRILWMGKGDGTFTVVSNVAGQDGTLTGYAPVLGDFNGDGKTDILWYAADANLRATGARVLWLTDGTATDVISNITTGLGATTALTYQPLTNSAIYTKDTTSVFPTFDTQLPMFVVSRVDVSSGVGGVISMTYAYAGGKTDINGRGFLGFRQLAATNVQTSILQATNYRQDFPYMGLVASSSKSLASLTLNLTTNTYGATSLGGTRNQVFTQQSVAQSSDLDGTSLPTITSTYQYDTFGNVTQMMVSTSDGFSKTTNNTYTNDSVNWFLGRLTASTVTSVAPTPSPPPSPSSPADLTIALAHSGSPWGPGQTGATYTITASNIGSGSTFGTVTVLDALPAGLTATAITGAGWSCALATLECTRGDVLAASVSYPPITLTVNVAANAPSSVTNVAMVSGGGETNSSNDTASNPTTIASTNVTIAANINNLNLWSYLTANGFASPGVAGSWVVTVNSGVVIGATSTSGYAFDTGTFPAGSVLTITNNGMIVGAGGAGGGGGTCKNSPHIATAGAAGGTAFHAQLPLRLTNNGSIWGGGGGGGGGSGSGLFRNSGNSTNFGAGGGGGGGGAGFGPGGPGGSDGQPGHPGAAGTASSGGAGGSSWSGITNPNNGTGGAGGGPAQAGAAGLAGIGGTSTCGPGEAGGGAPGAAILGNSLVTWVSTGDVRGARN